MEKIINGKTYTTYGTIDFYGETYDIIKPAKFAFEDSGVTTFAGTVIDSNGEMYSHYYNFPAADVDTIKNLDERDWESYLFTLYSLDY